LLTDEGPLLWPVDRAIMALPWGEDGYPSHGAYRDYRALTPRHHHVLANDGSPYDFGRAIAQTELDARDFVERVSARVAHGGVCVCALDTELLGHWWYEGVHWLGAVIDHARRRGLPLTTLHDGAARHEPVPAADELPITSWGIGNDLRTWSGPSSAEFAWQIRTAELRVLATGRRPSHRALRELMALQASDWAFLHSYGWAADYPRERADAHAAALARALAEGPEGDQSLRNLAPHLAGWEG
jgi:1,4-alpha-glucan branching enzyme